MSVRETPTDLCETVQLRTVAERSTATDAACEDCGGPLGEVHVTGTVRHELFGVPEYSRHPFCDERCLARWVDAVRAASGNVNAR